MHVCMFHLYVDMIHLYSPEIVSHIINQHASILNNVHIYAYSLRMKLIMSVREWTQVSVVSVQHIHVYTYDVYLSLLYIYTLYMRIYIIDR